MSVVVDPRRGWLACLALTLTLADSAHAQTSAFLAGPYVQQLQSDQVVVRFELREPATASVEVSTAGAINKVESPQAARLHSVRVTGLRPATTSTYLVRLGTSSSPEGTFTTPPADPTRPFSFLLYGDSRTDTAAHDSVIKAMVTTPSSFLIGTGDIVDSGGNREAWESFFSIERNLIRDRCLFSVIGNHELMKGKNPRQAWLQYFGPEGDQGRSYYSFRWGNSRFFMLDSNDSWDGAQALWLRNELERSDQEPQLVHRIVVLHQAPFSSGPHGSNRAFVRKGQVDLLRKHRVDLIVGGHDHLYERGEVEGLKYLITGGAGAPLYEPKTRISGSETTASLHHFVEVSVDGPLLIAAAWAPAKGLIERCHFRVGERWDCGQLPAPAASGSAAAPAAASAPPPQQDAEAARPVLQPPPQTPNAPTRCGCETPGRRIEDGAPGVLAFVLLVCRRKRTRLILTRVLRYAA